MVQFDITTPDTADGTVTIPMPVTSTVSISQSVIMHPATLARLIPDPSEYILHCCMRNSVVDVVTLIPTDSISVISHRTKLNRSQFVIRTPEDRLSSTITSRSWQSSA